MLNPAAYIFRAGLVAGEAMKSDALNRQTVRTLLTIMMYAGVGIFLVPYITGKAATAPLFMLLGAIVAVVCGLLRCYLTEGEGD
jgi:uncharacterized membrane protein